jgi:hypothetical protein
MLYPTWITLKWTMLAVGVLLIFSHAVALVRGAATQAWLRALPRSKPIGAVLMSVAGAWFFFLVKSMDLGEFTPWRNTVLIVTATATVLALFYMQDFLAARSLGMIALLVAEPLLESAWMRPEPVKLLLVSLTYVWIVAGMFWVGMPYTLRDQIAWVTATAGRWRASVFAGLAYGALLVVGALLVR